MTYSNSVNSANPTSTINVTTRLATQPAPYLDIQDTPVQLTEIENISPASDAVPGIGDPLSDITGIATNTNLAVDVNRLTARVYQRDHSEHPPQAVIALATTAQRATGITYALESGSKPITDMVNGIAEAQRLYVHIKTISDRPLTDVLRPYFERALACILDIQIRPNDYAAHQVQGFDDFSGVQIQNGGIMYNGNNIATDNGHQVIVMPLHYDTQPYHTAWYIMQIGSYHHFVGGNTPSILSQAYQTNTLPALRIFSTHNPGAGWISQLTPGHAISAASRILEIMAYYGFNSIDVTNMIINIARNFRCYSHVSLRDATLCTELFGNNLGDLITHEADLDQILQQLQNGQISNNAHAAFADILAQRNLVNNNFQLGQAPYGLLPYQYIYAYGGDAVRTVLIDIVAAANGAGWNIQNAVGAMNAVGNNITAHAEHVDRMFPVLGVEHARVISYPHPNTLYMHTAFWDRIRNTDSRMDNLSIYGSIFSLPNFLKFVFLMMGTASLAFYAAPYTAASNAIATPANIEFSSNDLNISNSIRGYLSMLRTLTAAYMHVPIDITSQKTKPYRFNDNFANNCYITAQSPELISNLFGVTTAFHKRTVVGVNAYCSPFANAVGNVVHINYCQSTITLSDNIFRHAIVHGYTPILHSCTIYNAQGCELRTVDQVVINPAQRAVFTNRPELIWYYHHQIMCDGFDVNAQRQATIRTAMTQRNHSDWHYEPFDLDYTVTTPQEPVLISDFAPTTACQNILNNFAIVKDIKISQPNANEHSEDPQPVPDPDIAGTANDSTALPVSGSPGSQ